jgi:ribosomal protein S18 acetylase RimI-like enzyme
MRVRPAALTDTREAAGLLLEPIPSLVDVLGSPRAALQVARTTFRSNHTIYSCRFAVAVENEGRLLGMLVAVPGATWPRLRVTTGLVMVGAAPHRAPWLIRRGRVLDRLTPAVPADSLYISSVAVADTARRRGAGSRLMQAALDRAGRKGFRRLTLDVGIENEGARALYTRAGFVEVSRGEATERDRKIIDTPGLIRLERALEPE